MDVDVDLSDRPPTPLPPEENDEWAVAFRDAGYEYCRPHGEWHRPPECEIDEDGNPDSWWDRP